MINVALLIKHPKLRDALISNFDSQRIQFREEKEWKQNSDIIFGKKSDILIIDFNTIKDETLDVFLTIDTMCRNEDIRFVLLVKKKSKVLIDLQNNLNRLSDIVETGTGRKEFDLQIRKIMSEVARSKTNQNMSEASFVDLQSEVHLELKEFGDIVDSSVFELLFSILIRKATGHLFLKNGPRELKFSFRSGHFVLREGSHHSEDLRLAISWKIGTYTFEKFDKMSGQVKDLEEILATGVREILPTRMAMQALMSNMEMYPIPTSHFETDRKLKLYYPEISEFKKFYEKGLKWKEIFAEHGEHYFNAAYFALKTHLIYSSPSSDLNVTVIWSQELRKARDRVERSKIEQTKAFKTAQDPENVERELRNTLREMQYQSPYEIFGLWEGCGKKNVRDIFYRLVKERHPDVYGNVSVAVKGYAQKIFISIKDAYAKLLSLEKTNAPIQSGEPSIALLLEPILVVEDTHLQVEDNTAIGVAKARTPTVGGNRTRSQVPRRTSSFGSDEPKKKRSATEVRAKMEQLSAMRKKRSRRKSFANKKVTQPRLTPAPISEVERILAESEVMESFVEEIVNPKNIRSGKLAQLRQRADKKNPNALSDAQSAFSEGYQLYRSGKITEAFSKFNIAYGLDKRASHKAFYAFTLFKTQEDKADEAEKLAREAIEMNDKQTQPDALFFLARMLKARGDSKNAYKFFESAFKLNPMNREAEREVRLYKIRKGDRATTDSGKFIKNLFKK